ncbi:MAG TPA: GAF domain-containing protein [Ktedonobacteraceae bacterium]|nr:GAF domain-containing protein [Ktedonobacteraceae bacterium]
MKDEDLAQISTEFYLQILNDRASLIEIIRKRELLLKIIKQALIQLDPQRLGMAITLALCMPPGKNGKVRSLRERMGQGTYPWDADLENLSIFLANDSLAGYVAQNQRPSGIDDLSKETLLPAYQTEDEVSAAAAPIMLEGHVAGCLLASSVEIAHFTQQRLSLLGSFSDLVSLALDPGEFYPREIIQLGVLRYKHPEEQRDILRAFPRLVQSRMLESYQTPRPLSYLAAEEIVWGELENQVLLG